MSAQANKALVHRLLDEMNRQRNLAIVDELLAPDFVEHQAFPPEIPRNREGVKHIYSLYYRAFSDIQVTIDEMIAEGDKVVCILTVQATHTDEFMGIPPTGKRVMFQAIDAFRIAGALVMEHWGISDRLTLLQQLGLFLQR
jgi:predicted ester cyclase